MNWRRIRDGALNNRVLLFFVTNWVYLKYRDAKAEKEGIQFYREYLSLANVTDLWESAKSTQAGRTLLSLPPEFLGILVALLIGFIYSLFYKPPTGEITVEAPPAAAETKATRGPSKSSKANKKKQ